MKVFLIKRSTMGGTSFMPTAYADVRVSQMMCDDLNTEWEAYTPIPVEGEEIGGDRVIVDNFVYSLDESDYTESLKARTLKKLNSDERAALGL